MVRAKFKCIEKSEYGTKANPTCGVKLEATAGDSPENKKFFKYTPSGSIAMTIMNPSAAEQFELGKEYYIDFTPAD